ncbi:hypothetical protein ON010_g16449 [Phytophthora cinnamomi]|nr:hypothetical protein ON010_g16449 [Phytophthora cinnamomi]
MRYIFAARVNTPWTTKPRGRLELEHLLAGVADLLEQALELALAPVRGLVARDGVHHRGRAAHADQVLVRRAGQQLLDELLGHVARVALPVGVGLVQHVVHLELRVHVLQRVQLVAEDDVLLRLVAEDEHHLRRVVRVAADLLDHLQGWGEARAAAQEADALVLVGLVLELDERALHGELVAHIQVHDLALLGVGVGGRVRVDHGLAVHAGLGHEAASHGDAHLVLLARQCENQAFGVVGHLLHLGHLEGAELLGAQRHLGLLGVARGGREAGQAQGGHHGGHGGGGGHGAGQAAAAAGGGAGGEKPEQEEESQGRRGHERAAGGGRAAGAAGQGHGLRRPQARNRDARREGRHSAHVSAPKVSDVRGLLAPQLATGREVAFTNAKLLERKEIDTAGGSSRARFTLLPTGFLTARLDEQRPLDRRLLADSINLSRVDQLVGAAQDPAVIQQLMLKAKVLDIGAIRPCQTPLYVHRQVILLGEIDQTNVRLPAGATPNTQRAMTQGLHLMVLWDDQVALSRLFRVGDTLSIFHPFVHVCDQHDAEIQHILNEYSSQQRLIYYFEYGSATVLFCKPCRVATAKSPTNAPAIQQGIDEAERPLSRLEDIKAGWHNFSFFLLRVLRPKDQPAGSYERETASPTAVGSHNCVQVLPGCDVASLHRVIQEFADDRGHGRKCIGGAAASSGTNRVLGWFGGDRYEVEAGAPFPRERADAVCNGAHSPSRGCVPDESLL